MLPESSVDNESHDSSAVQGSSGEVAWSTIMLAQIVFHAQRVHRFIVRPQVPEILTWTSPNPLLLYKFGVFSPVNSSNLISSTPTMHHLFTVKDLLFEICSYMTLADLSAAARVSSDWFWCAIPHLYKDLDIHQALSALGTISYPPSFFGLYHHIHFRFVKPTSDKEWERFSMYATYVQILNVDQSYDRAIFEAVLASQAKGHQYLFPNVRFLRWNTIAFMGGMKPPVFSDFDALCNSLISPRITQLDLRISDHQPALVRHVCQLLTRLINLRSLRIDLADSLDIASHPIQNVLNFFAETLESVAVHIPRRLTRPGPVTECQLLLRIHNLHNLIIHGNEGSFDETLTITESYEEYSRQNPLSQRSLFFGVSVPFLYDMLSSPFDFNSLTMFWWHLDVVPDQVIGFISFIVTACPRLQSLIFGAPRKKYIGRLFRPPQVPWSWIQPIVHCRELTRLSLNCIRVTIELEELEVFLQDRTTWTHLDIFTSRWFLRLQDLLLYAKYCPHLTHLGTFINTAVHIPLTELRPPGSPRFKALTCIDVARTIFLCYSHSEMGQFFYESCEKPVYFEGYSAKASHGISKCIASCYIDEEARSGVGMSWEAREYVKIVSKYKEEAGVET